MEKTYRQLTIKYAFLQSMYWITQCIFFSFAAVFLQYKNFNNTQIGIVLSLSSILSIILQPVVSAFADKSKKKTVRNIILTIMLIVLAFTVIFNIWNNTFIIIASIFVAINTLQITLNPLLNSIALEFLNNGYPFNFGLARGTGSIAFAITSFILGHAVSRFSPGIILPLFLVSYVFLFIAAYIYRIKSSSKVPGGYEDRIYNNTSDANTNPPASIFGFFIKYRRFTFLLLGIAMVFYSHNLVNTYLINIIKNVGGNSTDMGLSLTIAAALELPMMAAFTLIVKKVKCSTLIKISGFFFLIKSVTIWLAPNVMTVHISQAFQMLSFALFTPASIYYVNSIINEEDKNKGQAMLGAATIGIAGTIASITGGRLLDISGVSDMMMLGTIVALIGFVIILFSTEKSH
jgi:PPP family 3-phenylpropionic acid transporter